MSDDFDPYRKWLAIPPEEQPPNHYRLLGLPLLEDDPDVIENAANRQMAHVRTFQSGRHAALSQKILNELSVAKICLLNPEKKVSYDAEIKERLAAEAAVNDASVPAAPPPPRHVEPPNPQAIPLQVGPSPTIANPEPAVKVRQGLRPSAASVHRNRRKKTNPWGWILMGMLVVVALAIVLAMVVNLAQPTSNSEMGRNRSERTASNQKRGAGSGSGPGRGHVPLDQGPKPPDRPGQESPADSPETPGTVRFQEQLRQMRQHLGSRELGAAADALRDARILATTPEQNEQLEQVNILLDYLNQFQACVHQGIYNGLEDGDRFEFEGKTVELQSRENATVTYSIDGESFTFAEKELPTLHALAFASRQLDPDDPYHKINAATFLALDRHDADPEHIAALRERARDWWQEAAEMGQENIWVARELKIEP